MLLLPIIPPSTAHLYRVKTISKYIFLNNCHIFLRCKDNEKLLKMLDGGGKFSYFLTKKQNSFGAIKVFL